MDKKIKLITLGIFLIITFIVFGNSLASDFVFDDLAIVRDRPELKNIEHIPYLFFEPYHNMGYDGDIYRPITMASFSLNYNFLGEKPWGFHFINILLHALASWLIFLVLTKLTKKIDFSFIVALLFLILPIHTEPINAIVGRAEMLSLLFISLCLLLLLKKKTIRAKKKKISLEFWAGVLFLLALLSKESALGLLPLYFIILWINIKGQTFLIRLKTLIKKYWLNFSYLSSAIIIYFSMRATTLEKLVNTRSSIVENPLKFADWPERIFTALKVLGIYIYKTIWPYNNLSSDHSYNQIPVEINWTSWQFWLGAIILSLIIFIIAKAIIKPPKNNFTNKIFILSSSFFLFYIIITSNLLFTIGTILAERLMYIPSLAFCLLLAFLLIWLRDRFINYKFCSHFFITLCLIIICFYSFVSFTRNFDWKNENDLFRSAAARSPNSVLSRSNLGAIYLLENNLEAAEIEIIAAQNIYDNYNHNLNNLGLLYLKQGKLEKARDQFILTLKKYPSYGSTIDNLALTYFKLGEYEQAKKFWDIIYGQENAQYYLMAHFNNEFNKLISENKKTQAKILLEQAQNIVNNKKWVKKVEKAIK